MTTRDDQNLKRIRENKNYINLHKNLTNSNERGSESGICQECIRTSINCKRSSLMFLNYVLQQDRHKELM